MKNDHLFLSSIEKFLTLAKVRNTFISRRVFAPKAENLIKSCKTPDETVGRSWEQIYYLFAVGTFSRIGVWVVPRTQRPLRIDCADR